MAQILFKRGNSSNVTSLRLAAGEPAIALDTGKVYIGDGERNILINPDQSQVAEEAVALQNPREFKIQGDITAPAVEFDGTQNVTLQATLPNSGVSAGKHTKVTVNAKGIVTAGEALVESDIPQLGAAKITETDDKKFVTNAQRQKIDNMETTINNAMTFTNEGTTVVDFGGIAAGTDLNGLKVQEILKKLLFPYVAPECVGTMEPANGGIFENGTTQRVTTISLNITKGSNPITRVEAFDGQRSLGSSTDGVTNGGPVEFTVDESITGNKTFTVKITDGSEQPVEFNLPTFTFMNPYYHGVVAEGANIVESTVKQLTKVVAVKEDRTISYTANNQKVVLAYPKPQGKLRKIVDANGFDVTNAFECKEINMTIGQNTVAYYVYVAHNTLTITNSEYQFMY